MMKYSLLNLGSLNPLNYPKLEVYLEGQRTNDCVDSTNHIDVAESCAMLPSLIGYMWGV